MFFVYLLLDIAYNCSQPCKNEKGAGTVSFDVIIYGIIVWIIQLLLFICGIFSWSVTR